MLHLLHCLNFIRQEFTPGRYKNSPAHAHHKAVDNGLHRDHCVDAIRQSLMCHADLTPIPSRWFEGLGQSYIDTNRPHVCRNWNSIRAWATERFNGTTAVRPPKHRETHSMHMSHDEQVSHSKHMSHGQRTGQTPGS